MSLVSTNDPKRHDACSAMTIIISKVTIEAQRTPGYVPIHYLKYCLPFYILLIEHVLRERQLR